MNTARLSIAILVIDYHSPLESSDLILEDAFNELI